VIRPGTGFSLLVAAVGQLLNTFADDTLSQRRQAQLPNHPTGFSEVWDFQLSRIQAVFVPDTNVATIMRKLAEGWGVDF